MVSFWQLSGPDSHFSRNWQGAPGQPVGNAKIALQAFRSLSRKDEYSEPVIDLVLGIEISGASHILIPDSEHVTRSLSGLTWRNRKPYPGSRFASLSPLTIGRKGFQSLLEDRQKVSKSTTASKNKGDNSKANHMFCDGPPRPARAAFEHGRCFWKIVHRELRPETYGLPNAPWIKGINIISLAMNFWLPDRATFLDAGMTLLHLPLGSGSQKEHTWYFKSKDSDVLCNPSQLTKCDIPVTWTTLEVDNNNKMNIGMKIQCILETYSSPMSSPPTPVILLVHDYTTAMDKLVSLGVQTSMWKQGLTELLGYPILHQPHSIMNKPRDSHVQPCTQLHSSLSVGSSTGPFLQTSSSPPPVHSYAPVYVVDTMMMFQTVSGTGNHSSGISPVDVFNKITCSNEDANSCGGSDAHYIMQTWRAIVAGLSIDEQKAFYLKVAGNLPIRQTSSSGHNSNTAEDVGLYQVAESQDPYNDGTDSENDY